MTSKSVPGKSLPTYIVTLLLLAFLLGFLLRPADCMRAFLNGASLWAATVLPAVFPFLVCISLLRALGLLDGLCARLTPVTKLLFGCSGLGGFCIAMSLISGYPVGSKLLSSYVLEGRLSPAEAAKLAPVCSTSGPLFLIGSVGAGMFSSVKAGCILLASHVVATLLTGLAFRALPCAPQALPVRRQSQPLSLYDSIYQSAVTILCVGGFVALFAVVCELLSPLLSPLPHVWNGFVSGLIEMTRGCSLLAAAPSPFSLALCAFLVTLGGTSALLQQIGFLQQAHLKLSLFLGGKLLQAVLAFLLCYLIGAQQF